jgi:hypothetical protein
VAFVQGWLIEFWWWRGRKQSQLLEQLGLPLDDSTHLSPDVGDESDFEPFVRLRIPSPETTFAFGQGIPYSFVDDNPETFGEAEDLGFGYQFISVRPTTIRLSFLLHSCVPERCVAPVLMLAAGKEEGVGAGLLQRVVLVVLVRVLLHPPQHRAPRDHRDQDPREEGRLVREREHLACGCALNVCNPLLYCVGAPPPPPAVVTRAARQTSAVGLLRL